MSTVSGLFERIFQYAENQRKDDPSFGFSDHAGLAIVKSVPWSAVKSLLPQAVQKDADAALQRDRQGHYKEIAAPASNALMIASATAGTPCDVSIPTDRARIGENAATSA